MALNDDNRPGAPGSAERDPGLDRVYRLAGHEDPPARLDAAILAAARREVGARPRSLSSTLRRWRVPLSIAAVVVLSVSLVTLVEEEGGDRITGIPPVAPPPALEQKAVPPAPAAMAEGGREDRSAKRKPERQAAPAASTPPPTARPHRPAAPVEASPAPADAASGRVIEPFPALRKEQQPQAAAVAPQPKAGAPALPDLLAKPAPAPSARARDEAAVGIRGMAAESPSTVEARRSAAQEPANPAAAQEADAAMAGRVMSSASPVPGASAAKPAPKPAPRAAVPDPLRSMESGGATVQQRPPIWSDLERQPPEKWLERIEALRRAGRTVELNELLVEFRKRFPNHPLPDWAR